MAQFRCILHGSFSKHFDGIQRAHKLLTAAGIEVLAPKAGELVSQSNGFGLFEDEVGQDPRMVELLYLHNLKRLGDNGFSYFINPGGYIGKSASSFYLAGTPERLWNFNQSGKARKYRHKT